MWSKGVAHVISKELRLLRRPEGVLREGDFEVVETEVPVVQPGQVLVRNTHHSVDAAIRVRLDAVTPPGYLPSIPLGGALEGLVVGEVVESQAAGFEIGDLVQHSRGYREMSVVDAGVNALGGAGRLVRLDPALAPQEVHLGLLGGTGLTAWAGIVAVAATKPGDVVWVSTAAGAVGSVAAQLAKIRGARVIGSTGSPGKVDFLRNTLRLDAAFDYHGDMDGALSAAAPDGIDVYFDNVGGRHLEIALDHLRPFGRVALCGAVSGYNGPEVPGPRNLFLATAKNLTLRGFRAGAYADRWDEAVAELAALWRSGVLNLQLARYDGLEAAPSAIVDLLSGRNTGKCVVVT